MREEGGGDKNTLGHHLDPFPFVGVDCTSIHLFLLLI